MALLYPVVLIAAAVIVSRRPHAPGGWRWFGAWSAAGALMTFSFVTGFSIGLLFLPLAAATVIWVARHAPDPVDASGFVLGLGAVIWAIGFLNPAYRSWLVPGFVISACGLLPYAIVRSRRLGRERG